MAPEVSHRQDLHQRSDDDNDHQIFQTLHSLAVHVAQHQEARMPHWHTVSAATGLMPVEEPTQARWFEVRGLLDGALHGAVSKVDALSTTKDSRSR